MNNSIYCQCGCGGLAPIAKHSHKKYGWIKGEPKKYILGHAIRVKYTLSTEERFWEKVIKLADNECWEWQACEDKDGYGRFWYNNITGRAHVYSYEKFNGVLKDNENVFHHCDNPSCVNPAHLFSGPNRVNSADMVRKGRSAKGEHHGMSKLTYKKVDEIHERWNNGETQTAIAKSMNVSQTTVGRVVLKQSWNS